MRTLDLPKYKLTKEENIKVDDIISEYSNRKSLLIPVLQKIQNAIGFLPVEAQKKVARGIMVPEKDVYGVVTFYSFFTMIPRGKNNIRVCMGTACFVKGAGKIVEKISRELKIKPGETTPDRIYSFQINRCLGACGLAPVMVINDKIYQKVNPDKAIELIYSYK
jgi:NADP-reducing hydrogenase subunit HndA